jgi:hypothetical protein
VEDGGAVRRPRPTWGRWVGEGEGWERVGRGVFATVGALTGAGHDFEVGACAALGSVRPLFEVTALAATMRDRASHVPRTRRR